MPGRSLEQAKDNLVQLSNGFFPGADKVEVESGPSQASGSSECAS